MKSFLTVARRPLLSKMLLVMKVTTFLLLVFSLHVAGRGIGQEKLNLDFKKTEISSILTFIEKETNYRFLYNNQLNGIRQKISLQMADVTIRQALDQLFSRTGLTYQFMENNLIIVKEEERSYKPITGKITDENGAPLNGVSVKVKGSTRGTATDEKGDFSINAENGEVLVFSYVGFESQEYKIGDAATISLALVSVKKDLEALVVIGYGQVKKKDLTGAVISVKSDEIKKVPASNLIESLQGKLPGADITRSNGSAASGVNITIRGNRSITAGNGPLFIVDGVQYNSIQDINPNDIQSLEVLKDASSTAIYGSRGANGVIIVTTKKGTTGKPKVSLNAYYGVASLTDFPRFMNAEEHVAHRRESNRKIALANINPGGNWSSPANDPLIFAPTEMAAISTGNSYDYLDMLFRDGNQQEYQVGVSAGGDKTKVYMSLDYYSEKGIFKWDKLDRYSARMNIDQNLGKILKAGMQLQYTNYNIDLRTSPIDEATKLFPFFPPYDSAGNMIYSPDAARWNPLADEPKDVAVNNTIVSRTLGVTYLELTPFKGFSLRSNLGLVFSSSKQGAFYAPNSLLRRGTSSLAQYIMGTSRNITWENILTYSKQFGDHNLVFTGVTSFLQNNFEQGSAAGQRQVLPSQLFYALQNATEGVVITSSYSKDNLVSFSGRVHYSFLGKYLASFTIRRDGSSKLAEGNKWDVFPSAAIGWRISEEAFLSNSKFISDLKIRTSYGVTGNDAVPPYRTQSALTRIPNAFGENSALGFTFSDTVGNPDLTWEKTKAFNVGIDFGFWNNRVSGTIDYYHTNTYDLLLDRLLPPTSGVSRTLENIGQTRNTGLDIMINVAVIRKQKMSFNAGITFFSNKEEIVDLVNGVNDVGNRWFIGSPVRVLYDYKRVGIWQLGDSTNAAAFNQKPGDIRVEDINGDKKITPDDRAVIGQMVPKWNTGLNLDFRYGQFDANIFLFARYGQMMDYAYLGRFHLPGRENSAALNYWTPENPSNDFPHPRTSSSFDALPYSSTLSYVDASFVKVRSITLGYSLPPSVTSKLRISSLRFYVNGKNLFSFSKVKDYDVERGGSLINPLTKLVTAGVNVEF